MRWWHTISGCRTAPVGRFGRWAPPAIVAEALVAVPDVLGATLRPGPPVAGRAAAAALARLLAPAEREAPAAPGWLRPAQRVAFRRVLAALENFGGALLADPVGSGKTYVALAAAAAAARECACAADAPTVCLVPATLVGQWRVTAARLGVAVVVHSHELVSRGRLPPRRGALVIVDESHRFRNPAARRYAHLAPWLLGARVLLLSATPVVNRLADLRHQLALGVRDDALRLDGVPSLAELLDGHGDSRARGRCRGRGHPALGRLVVTSDGTPGRPTRRRYELRGDDDDELRPTLQLLDALRLSRDPAVAALIRVVLLRAAASSPAALADAVARYRRLLLHARDAAESGRAPTRGGLRALMAGAEDQLLFWPLLALDDGETELAADDLADAERLHAHARERMRADDGKARKLRRLLRDARPTLVFASHRATVHWLRRRLGDPAVAWCTGERAGIGAAVLPRDAVLDWFRPGAMERAEERAGVAGLRIPRVLLASDVAAEGLDLQRAARVVHYDLPWTAVRLEQREGRAARLGSAHRGVAVLRFAPAPALEERLRQLDRLESKRRLASAAGLDADGRWLWRWRADAAARFDASAADSASPAAGVAAVSSEKCGLLVGFTLNDARDGSAVGARLLHREADGRWSEEPALLAGRLAEAARSGGVRRATPAAIAAATASLAPCLRDALRAARMAGWEAPATAPAARLLLGKLQHLARGAARVRDRTLLARIEGAARAVAGGHTAGERRWLEGIVGLSHDALLDAIGRLPRRDPDPLVLEIRLVAIVIFCRDGAARHRGQGCVVAGR